MFVKRRRQEHVITFTADVTVTAAAVGCMWSRNSVVAVGAVVVEKHCRMSWAFQLFLVGCRPVDISEDGHMGRERSPSAWGFLNVIRDSETRLGGS